MQRLLEESNIQFVSNKIFIPENKHRVKIDVGLSYSAPVSQYWLTQEKDLLVFGFEPNPEAVACIRSPYNKKKAEGHGDVLEHKYLDKDFFVIRSALGSAQEKDKLFYIATKDEGCSSFYKPSGLLFDTEKTINVNVFTLSDFFQYFPWEQIPYIEYLKIDAQGADLDILRGASDYIKKIVYVTAESSVGNLYIDVKDNDVSKVDNFMRENGFLRINHPNTSDPTYVNHLFLDIAPKIFIWQKE